MRYLIVHLSAFRACLVCAWRGQFAASLEKILSRKYDVSSLGIRCMLDDFRGQTWVCSGSRLDRGPLGSSRLLGMFYIRYLYMLLCDRSISVSPTYFVFTVALAAVGPERVWTSMILFLASSCRHFSTPYLQVSAHYVASYDYSSWPWSFSDINQGEQLHLLLWYLSQCSRRLCHCSRTTFRLRARVISALFLFLRIPLTSNVVWFVES